LLLPKQTNILLLHPTSPQPNASIATLIPEKNSLVGPYYFASPYICL
ncbi:MAG: hypothetical protein ACI957_005096, partial [Verrucomicrobiales bacterium]